MAASFVRRNVTPGEPTRITLPSTKLMMLLELDGKTRIVTLGSDDSARVQGMNYSIVPADEAGVYRDSTGQWYGYLSEDRIND